jgi:hypothetical protein
MTPIKNTQELNFYIDQLEKRLERLEARPVIPEDGVVHRSFFRRAFSIWGHWFVANAVIAMVTSGCAALIYALALLGLLQMFSGGGHVIPTP